jgi:hypothetical protein
VAPFVLATSTAGLYNDVLFGAVIATVAGYNYYRTTDGGEVGVGAAGLVALAGAWMVVAPFVLGGIGGAALYSDVTVGVLVALFGGYNAYVASGTEDVGDGTRRSTA